MSPLGPSNKTKVDPEKSNISETQDKDFKISSKNEIESFKEEVNQFLWKSMKKKKEQAMEGNE